jgi:hypothetical protein
MDSDYVLERLNALERSNQRMKLSLVALLAGFCACAGVTADYDSVSAKRFVLRGEDGTELASLVREGGGARLVLNADDRRARVVLDVNGVRVFDPAGRAIWRSAPVAAAPPAR